MTVNIVIPDYAQGRIKRYNLTEHLVKETPRHPDEVVEGYEERFIAHKSLDDEHVLRVIYLKVEETVRVVTVYPAKKQRYFHKK